MASVNPLPAADGVPKRRACDECRTRKLACSKEPDGCSRCQREGIPCYYSPQKPMGRPRKRRHVDEGAPPAASTEVMHHHGLMPSLSTVSPQQHAVSSELQVQPSSNIDQSLSFLDEINTYNIDFWGIPDDYLGMPADPNLLANNEGAVGGTATAPPLNLTGVDLLGNINFDEPDHSEAMSRDLGASLQRYMAEQVSLPQGTSLSTTADSTLGSDHDTSAESQEDSAATPPPSMRPVPTINCSCLSSLFLALDSLSRLPPEVVPAMRTARNASKVAHDVINCPNCSVPIVDAPGSSPPIQAFQNLMFLGTLVPSACNAYANILERVDAETALAKKQGRNFWFSFKDIGGLWGEIGEGSECCSSIQTYNNIDMAPDLWRTTIRAILRLDVYGLTEVNNGVPQRPPYTHIGLRDVVRLLEERTRKRHEMIDALVETGQVAKAIPKGVIYPSTDKQCLPEDRNCVRILETARIALDNLVIA